MCVNFFELLFLTALIVDVCGRSVDLVERPAPTRDGQALDQPGRLVEDLPVGGTPGETLAGVLTLGVRWPAMAA